MSQSQMFDSSARLLKARRATYHVDAWIEAVNEYAGTAYKSLLELPRLYSPPALTNGSMPIDLSRLISQKQAAARHTLGLPEPKESGHAT